MNIYPDWPRPGDALLFYQRASEGLRLLPKMADMLADLADPFWGMPMQQLREEAARMIEELKLQCVMTMTASVEATFQTDLLERANRKLKDQVSRALRQQLKKTSKKDARIRIEDILDIWKREMVKTSLAIGNLKQVIEFRHWLAHGRYWKQKSGLKQTDPFDVWNRWEDVLNVITKEIDFPLE